MSEIILGLEAFGGGEEIGCVAATVTLTKEKIISLINLAETLRSDPIIIRMVFHDSTPTRWFVEASDNEIIADFTQDASGYKIIDKHPGEANLFTEARTIHATGGSEGVFFSWNAIDRKTQEPVASVKVPESFLREIGELF